MIADLPSQAHRSRYFAIVASKRGQPAMEALRTHAFAIFQSRKAKPTE